MNEQSQTPKDQPSRSVLKDGETVHVVEQVGAVIRPSSEDQFFAKAMAVAAEGMKVYHKALGVLSK